MVVEGEPGIFPPVSLAPRSTRFAVSSARFAGGSIERRSCRCKGQERSGARRQDSGAMVGLRLLSDGAVLLRPFTSEDEDVLLGGRDEESLRFLGTGDLHPSPAAYVVVNGSVVGWVDYDVERPWLEAGEVNLGYNLFAPFRGNGYASRAVKLLMKHLATDTAWDVATLLIHPDNTRSLALARRLAFTLVGDLDGNPYWKQPVNAFEAYGLAVAP